MKTLTFTLTDYEADAIELLILEMPGHGPTLAAHNRIRNKIDRARYEQTERYAELTCDTARLSTKG